ncbi:uncharacterized protein BO97DRAFT_113567 [Aspergillus homomorphus CBS 101889]|uniref:Uncharacterized protein n=1 Tax=Aspergillus homomorphus (strain CBS 101889) TaxID=1450537 RepID=A0A395HTV2_ASPHC|nr:hypothetical protein BO97DRAFT_113567 [Aspergillus homomorphus CBS 101889]RAL10815.1 hypothetical protein BO97DRAFT_113567 [Aspergillus homomorphus CBS 101889]
MDVLTRRWMLAATEPEPPSQTPRSRATVPRRCTSPAAPGVCTLRAPRGLTASSLGDEQDVLTGHPKG